MVSHDLESLIDLCSREVWIEGGTSRAEGAAREVVDAYRATAV